MPDLRSISMHSKGLLMGSFMTSLERPKAISKHKYQFTSKQKQSKIVSNSINQINIFEVAGTTSKIYIQIVFAVKFRQRLIQPEWEEQLYRYITGIIQNKGQKLIVINGTEDHIHIFIGMLPTCCLSDLVREVKKHSNEFVHRNHFSRTKFAWQGGFGAFSYGHSQLGRVIRYIQNQKEHHKHTTFKKEYLTYLKKFEVDHDEKLHFEWMDE